MEKIYVKKLFISFLIAIPFGVLTSCAMNNNKKVPENGTRENQLSENTLAVFEIDNEKNYLINVELINRDKSDFYTYIMDNDCLGNGDYFIEYLIVTGNYPKDYSKNGFLLHIIPEDNIYKFESQLMSWNEYENYKEIMICFETDGQFHFVGYSNDENLLETKVLKYYLKNKEKSEK